MYLYCNEKGTLLKIFILRILSIITSSAHGMSKYRKHIQIHTFQCWRHRLNLDHWRSELPRFSKTSPCHNFSTPPSASEVQEYHPSGGTAHPPRKFRWLSTSRYHPLPLVDQMSWLSREGFLGVRVLEKYLPEFVIDKGMVPYGE